MELRMELRMKVRMRELEIETTQRYLFDEVGYCKNNWRKILTQPDSSTKFLFYLLEKQNNICLT